jgi:hypothetical protein
MVAAGATSADLAILEKYRGQQLQKIVDDQTSSLRDLQKTLNGDASGKTGYALLQDSLAEYSKLQADMKAGVAVDNDDLVSAAQDVLSRAGSTYGTATSQYQSIVSMLKADTANAISSTEARVQASQDAATKAQAEWLEEQRLANVEATKQTALLTQLVAAAASGNGSGSTSMWKYVNGSAQGSMA